MVGSKNEYVPETVSAPGRSLKRAIDAVGMTQTQLAARLGKTEKFVSEVINGKAPITPETAIHLERVLGTPATYWNSRETAYREWAARQAEANELALQVEWARTFPLRKMIDFGWIQKTAAGAAQAEELLDYFGIATPREWAAVWGELPAVAFRQSKSINVDRNALSAWLRYGEIAGQQMACADFDKGLFQTALVEARQLTVTPPEVFVPRLVELCGNAGVALVFTPDLPKTGTSAAVRWLTPSRALIQLGLRYKTDDHLWFSFFHEAAHVLKHGKKMLFLETGGLDDGLESEASRIAGDWLIPPAQYKRFVANKPYSKVRISQFAEEIGIAPGIVVGRLQHDGLVSFADCNGLKQHFEWAAA